MLVVYGSGCSINDLTNVDINFLNQFDSIAFNWFFEIKEKELKPIVLK
jgi:hypothetical protein